ncbi:hypothetical protein CBR_g34142 [Chara braunii]|uniref:Reverse transcriptase RNase H-like domain-containing protein n=1 Tax=Chara braunii TaxID=69332 RepID=A0A388LI20_CHABU|nr:hypothetical protein CBR_g34142 [Chara braunii]|eukprot:GBG81959.1 hypothetical protein CBR_g34142 [Chara braunii]
MTGASQYGIGVVLQQDDGHGYRPVEFMSCRLPNEKVTASTYEQELYALREDLNHWRHYLLGRHFKVYSDHETLRWLKTQARITPKLTRWAAEIDMFDFELKPAKGKYNAVADALSHRSYFFGVIVTYLDLHSTRIAELEKVLAKEKALVQKLEQLRLQLESRVSTLATELDQALHAAKTAEQNLVAVKEHAEMERNAHVSALQAQSQQFQAKQRQLEGLLTAAQNETSSAQQSLQEALSEQERRRIDAERRVAALERAFCEWSRQHFGALRTAFVSPM